MHSGIRAVVLEEICALAKKHQIKKVILFGSRARGDHRQTSDIDLAVSGGDVVQFTLEVDESTSTLLKYDVINMDGAVQEELVETIIREGRVLYEEG